jgi:pimeloyl-ACP methyl ester carboxylesterase
MKDTLVAVPGGRIHVVEEGEGPLVLLVHGFPELWYSWRYQLPAVAAAGFRAAAIDVRGYGRSSKPADIAAYRMLDLVADNVEVVRALGAETAVVIGHDWGSSIAANSALLRPDVFTALGLLNVPYTQRGDTRPALAPAGPDAEEFYASYFQQPGRAEAEIETDVRSWLAGFYSALSGDAPEDSPPWFLVSPGGTLRDRMPDARTSWLSEADLDYYAAEFERTGFRGPLNKYRNIERDWEDLAPWRGAPIRQPAIYIAGELDTRWYADRLAAHERTLPGLVSSHIIKGKGHWIQQDAPDEVNRLLVQWLTGLAGAAL